MRTKLNADKYPEDWEFRLLLDGINLRSTWGKRTYLMILFLCHTGLRIGEMTRLTVGDVAWKGEPREEVYLVHSITKGQKSRVVPFNSVARSCVRKLLEFNEKRGFSTRPLLAEPRGRARDPEAPGEGRPIGQDYSPRLSALLWKPTEKGRR